MKGNIANAMAEEQQVAVAIEVAGDDYEPERFPVVVRFECPHCHEGLRIVSDVTMSLRNVRTLVDLQQAECRQTGSLKGMASVKGKISETEKGIVERAEATGILKAFAEAVSGATSLTDKPAHIGNFFLTFLRTMRPKQVPMSILGQFKTQFPNTYITVWCAHGIACIAVDGYLRFFIPSAMLRGEKLQPLGGHTGGGTGKPQLKLDADEAGVREWLRTRRGYVPVAAHEFIDALRKRSLGEFDR